MEIGQQLERGQQWKAYFNPRPAHGAGAPLPDGVILAREDYVLTGTSDEEQSWWDEILPKFEAGVREGIAGMDAEEVLSTDEAYDTAATEFMQGCLPERDGLYDPRRIEVMLYIGSDLLSGGFIEPGELMHPAFPLAKASDVLLQKGYEYSTARALGLNRGVIAWNLLADWCRAMPLEARMRIAAKNDLQKLADGIKARFQNDLRGSLDGWIAEVYAQIGELA